MPDMNDKDLNSILDSYEAPQPSELLKARILKASQSANDTQDLHAQDADILTFTKPVFAKRYMAIAASFVLICAAVLTTSMLGTDTSDTAWQVAANDLGFDELYDWVESDISTSP